MEIWCNIQVIIYGLLVYNFGFSLKYWIFYTRKKSKDSLFDLYGYKQDIKIGLKTSILGFMHDSANFLSFNL